MNTSFRRGVQDARKAKENMCSKAHNKIGFVYPILLCKIWVQDLIRVTRINMVYFNLPCWWAAAIVRSPKEMLIYRCAALYLFILP